jgi:CRP/FNR family cyclic AMP-dependent transcriptional regulator
MFDSIADLARVSFRSGETLFLQGDPGDCCYLVVSGHVEVFRQIGGIPVTLAVVDPGGLLGEVALIDGGSRAANAVALGDTECVRITPEALARRIEALEPMQRLVVESLLDYVRTGLRLLDEAYAPPQDGDLDWDGEIRPMFEAAHGMAAAD